MTDRLSDSANLKCAFRQVFYRTQYSLGVKNAYWI